MLTWTPLTSFIMFAKLKHSQKFKDFDVCDGPGKSRKFNFPANTVESDGIGRNDEMGKRSEATKVFNVPTGCRVRIGFLSSGVGRDYHR